MSILRFYSGLILSLSNGSIRNSPIWAEFLHSELLRRGAIKSSFRFTPRADDSHAASVPKSLARGLEFPRAYIGMSSPGEVFRFVSNWTTRSTACAGPRQFLWVLSLRSYSPGALLNALAATVTLQRLSSRDSLRLGLHRSLICFAPPAFVPQRHGLTRCLPTPLVFPMISTHFTATPSVPAPSSTIESDDILPKTMIKS